MTVDLDRAALLIEVIKGCAELGPKEANSISGMASVELREMDAEAKKELEALAREAKEREIEAEKERRAKVAEEAKAVEAEKPKDEALDETPPDYDPHTPGTQTSGPQRSKTDQTAVDNMRRL